MAPYPYLGLYYGPVQAGKTTCMVQEVIRRALEGWKCLVIKFSIDVRRVQGNSIMTHGGTLLTEEQHSNIKIQIWDKDSISTEDFALASKAHDLIAIDEAHFMREGLLSKAYEEVVKNNGKAMLASIINTWHDLTPVKGLCDVINFAEKAKMKMAHCHRCREKRAIYSLKVTKEVGEGKILVGGIDEYKPVCRVCLDRINNPNQKMIT